MQRPSVNPDTPASHEATHSSSVELRDKGYGAVASPSRAAWRSRICIATISVCSQLGATLSTANKSLSEPSQDHSRQDADDHHENDRCRDLELAGGEPLPPDVFGPVLDVPVLFRHVHPSRNFVETISGDSATYHRTPAALPAETGQPGTSPGNCQLLSS